MKLYRSKQVTKTMNRNAEHRLGQLQFHRRNGPRRCSALRIMEGGAALLFLSVLSTLAAAEDPFVNQEPPPVVGRWDLVVHGTERDYPS